jgi:hypothetical protein
VVANNTADIKSNSDNYLIDLTVHAKSIAKFVKPVKKIRLSRSQACSGFISYVSNNGLIKILFNDTR